MIKLYRIRGWFKAGSGKIVFTKEIKALSKEQALERVYSELGSKHKVKRCLIRIEEVTESSG